MEAMMNSPQMAALRQVRLYHLSPSLLKTCYMSSYPLFPTACLVDTRHFIADLYRRCKKTRP